MDAKSCTKGGALHAAPLDRQCNFAIKLWNKLEVDTVIKSIKKYGISNTLNSTEDDFYGIMMVTKPKLTHQILTNLYNGVNTCEFLYE